MPSATIALPLPPLVEILHPELVCAFLAKVEAVT
jgi:hypothetical protein